LADQEPKSLADQELMLRKALYPQNLADQEPPKPVENCGPFGTKVWPFRNQSLALSEPRWAF